MTVGLGTRDEQRNKQMGLGRGARTEERARSERGLNDVSSWNDVADLDAAGAEAGEPNARKSSECDERSHG